MKEFLTSRGWFVYHSCNCSGQYQEQLKHQLTKITIKIYYKSEKYTARNRNQIVSQGKENELKAFIKELFQEK